MPSGQVVTEFSAPPEDVWNIITDFENAPSWVPDLMSVRRIDSGPLAIGSQFEQVMRVQGRNMQIALTIREVDAPRTIAHTGEGKSVKISGRATITETPTGCRVVNEWSIELSGLMKLAAPIAGSWTQNNIEESMRALGQETGISRLVFAGLSGTCS